MKQAAYNLCYLAACAVNGIAPSKEECEKMELDKLYKFSGMHSLTALAAMELVAAGVEISSEWKQARDKAVRKHILFNSEREAVLKYMEKNGIWYLPLKGIILKDMYPKIGMREMSDNDILFDETYRRQMFEFMKVRGYSADGYGKSNHDAYTKEPVFNIELHVSLFAEQAREEFYRYYKKVKDRLVRIEGTEYGYRMTDEDYYVYMTAHEYKHYSNGGTGLRSLLDRYVYLLDKKDVLDFEYIGRECKKLRIADFEKDARILCEKLFSGESISELTEEENSMFEYYMFSSTYGTMYNTIAHRLKTDYGKVNETSKLRYVWRRAFPKTEFYREYAPFAYKYKIFIPFVCIYRILVNVGKMRKEIDLVKSIKE